MKPKVHFRTIKDQSYQEVWDLQTKIHKDLIDNKLKKRSLPIDQQKIKNQLNELIFCEHLPVYTLGKSGSMENLLLRPDKINGDKIEFFKINRGGDITYHGPGQITGYPIFDLDEFFTDVHLYVRKIEDVIIKYLEIHNLCGIRLPKYTGVWLAPDNSFDKYRKICAIGVHLSRWVSMHGFAFNVNTDLSYFDKIIPCGIIDNDKTVTSLRKETGKTMNIDHVSHELGKIFSEVFDFDIKVN